MQRDDDRWRERIDERINSLTTSETVQNDRLDEQEEELRTIHQMLEGKASDKDDNGIKGDLLDLTREFNKLRAIMAPDSLGSGGIINRLRALERDEDRRTKSVEYRWKYWTAVTVAVMSLAGFILKDWTEIKNTFYGPRTDRVGKEIEKVKHPKVHRRRVEVKVEPAVEAPTTDESPN